MNPVASHKVLLKTHKDSSSYSYFRETNEPKGKENKTMANGAPVQRRYLGRRAQNLAVGAKDRFYTPQTKKLGQPDYRLVPYILVLNQTMTKLFSMHE